MTKKEIADKKDAFKKALKTFLYVHIRPNVLAKDGQWTIKGFIDLFKNLYTISSDTKIVSKIIEIHLFPRILEFAEINGFNVILAEQQNWYPDMTFVSKEDEKIKYALDIKTTYRTPENPEFCNGFTLGSHGEYFINRESKKNIQFPYREYLAHICLGIIYTRSDLAATSEREIYKVKELFGTESDGTTDSHTKRVDNLRSITSVVRDFEFFVVDKWQIASDSSGSGNTANIGSIKCIDDIINGRGVFMNLDEQVFDDYWMNYGKITITGAGGKSKKITKLKEFLKYRKMDETLANSKTKKTKHTGTAHAHS